MVESAIDQEYAGAGDKIPQVDLQVPVRLRGVEGVGSPFAGRIDDSRISELERADLRFLEGHFSLEHHAFKPRGASGPAGKLNAVKPIGLASPRKEVTFTVGDRAS